MKIDRRKIVVSGIIFLLGFTVWSWQTVFSRAAGENAFYVLDIGQGDAQLIVLTDTDHRRTVKILIDAGPGRKILEALDTALGRGNDKYLDLLLMTHPDLDHFGGFIDVIKSYRVGLFLWNGKRVDTEAFRALEEELGRREIPQLELLAGDTIRYQDHLLSVISPDREWLLSSDDNEASLVAALSVGESKTLLTADIGFKTERRLLASGADLRADILKVGHHGSKGSSGRGFVAAVDPLLAAIGVGENRYGHPAPEVLKILEESGARVCRTDQKGTIKISLDEDFSAEETSSGAGATLWKVITGQYRSLPLTVLSLPRLKAVAAPAASGTMAVSAGPAPGCRPGQIDVNRAAPEELMEIRHIGEARAAAIVAARPLHSLAELRLKVSGIGEIRLRDIVSEDLACVGAPE